MENKIIEQLSVLLLNGRLEDAINVLIEYFDKDDKLKFDFLPILMDYKNTQTKSILGYYEVNEELQEFIRLIRKLLNYISINSNENLQLQNLREEDKEKLSKLIISNRLKEAINLLYSLSYNYPNIVKNRIIELGYEYNTFKKLRNLGRLNTENERILRNKVADDIVRVIHSLNDISKFDYFNFNSLVFVMIAFNDDMEEVYNKIKKIGNKYNFNPIRVKDVQGSYKINEKIVDLVTNAHFIIADLTHERPNVYYELGYARGIGKKIITLCNVDSQIHFDVQGWKHIRYSNLNDLGLNLDIAINSIKTGKDQL